MMLPWVKLLAAVAIVQFGSKSSEMAYTIREVKAKYERQLMSQPGVISVGIGRGDDGKPVIVVGLDGLRPETRKAMPKELEGYRVRVEVTGPIKAQ